MDKMRKTDMTARERTSHEQDHSTSKKHHHHSHAHASMHGEVTICSVEDLCVSFSMYEQNDSARFGDYLRSKNMRFG